MLPHFLWRGERIPSLALGTAQLGLPGYGIANTAGELDRKSAAEIVRAAWMKGVRIFDTAQAYGDSEKKLGNALLELDSRNDAPRIITKVSPELTLSDIGAVTASLADSLNALRTQSLWAVLLHRFSALREWNDETRNMFANARREGTVRHLGVSVYTPEEAKEALEHPHMDIVQLPANAWDSRMLEQGVFELARRKGKLVIVRSVFLQGLLLHKPLGTEAKVPGSEDMATVWSSLCVQLSRSPLALALDWANVLGVPLVMGAESVGQITEIADHLRNASLPEAMFKSINEQMRIVRDDMVIDPRRWP